MMWAYAGFLEVDCFSHSKYCNFFSWKKKSWIDENQIQLYLQLKPLIPGDNMEVE